MPGTGFDRITIDGAVVRPADELGPVAGWWFSVLGIGNDGFEKIAALLVPEKCHEFRIGEKRNIIGVLDGI